MRRFGSPAAWAALALLLPPFLRAAAPLAGDLRCEYRSSPLGVDETAPRLSWTLKGSGGDERGVVQAAYRILAARDPALLGTGRADLWDSGKVASARSFDVRYGGLPLASLQACHWKVKVWDGEGRESPWSETVSWTMGLLSPSDWEAKWIGRNPLLDPWLLPWIWYPEGKPAKWAPEGAVVFRRRFSLPAERVREAVFLVAAEDSFEICVNGAAAGRGGGRKRPHEFGVAPLLRPGPNLIALRAVNSSPSPAGIAGRLLVRFAGKADPLVVPLDREWRAGRPAAGGWEKEECADADWPPAAEVSAWSSSPWGTPEMADNPLPIFRTEFSAGTSARRAILCVCGLGHYELRLNGEKVGDRLLDPGWTNYWRTCLYSTYDVTALIRPGRNALGLMLGNGMFNVRGGRYAKFRESFGPPRGIVQLRLDFADGSSQTVGSGGAWKAAPGPIVFSCIYGGEDYDARRESPGWDLPGFDDSSWEAAAEVGGPGGKLVSQAFPPLKAMEEIAPVRSAESRPGALVYDLGTNIAGWPRIKLKGLPGTTVRITPGELLGPDGRVNQEWSGKPTYYTYACRGGGEEEWQPRFSYTGFRYLQVETAEGEKPEILELKGVPIRSSAERIGSFSCSAGLLNRIHALILRAIESNLMSILTDCPHREKFGWLEQTHLMGPSLMYDFDVPLLLGKIVRDMADAQGGVSGIIPACAPEYQRFEAPFRDAPAWGSAYVILPWLFYQRYGDDSLIASAYGGMKKYSDYLERISRGGIISRGLGDWMDVGPNPPYAQNTPVGLTSTAFHYLDLSLLEKMAHLLGKDEDARDFARRARETREAFNREYLDPKTGRYGTGSQTAGAAALCFGLAPADRRPAVLENLISDIRDRGGHTTAGDVGHRFVLLSLAEAGRSDMVAAMAAQTDHPSYGYQLLHGATSLTEFWDGPTRGHSQNHLMMGHLEEWLYRYLAGIEIDYSRPAPERIVIRPSPVAGIDSVRAATRVREGEVASSWERRGDEFSLTAVIPPNAAAVVAVPASSAAGVTESNRPAGESAGVSFLEFTGGAARYRVGSGSYLFRSRLGD